MNQGSTHTGRMLCVFKYVCLRYVVSSLTETGKVDIKWQEMDDISKYLFNTQHLKTMLAHIYMYTEPCDESS